MQVPLPQVSEQPQAPTRLGGGSGVVPFEDRGIEQTQRGMAALGSAGEAATKIAGEHNIEHATATARAELNKWNAQASDRWLSYRSQVGEAAIMVDGKRGKPGDASGRVVADMEGDLRVSEKSLPTDLARRIFRTYAQRGLTSFRTKATTHEQEQTRVHLHGENVAALGQETDLYAQEDDPAVAAEHFGAAMATAGEIASNSGKGKKQRAALLKDASSSLHANRVAVLMQRGDTKAADEYLSKQDRGSITSQVRQKLRASINSKLKKEVAREVGLNLFLRNGYRTQEDWNRAARAKAFDGATATVDIYTYPESLPSFDEVMAATAEGPTELESLQKEKVQSRAEYEAWLWHEFQVDFTRPASQAKGYEQSWVAKRLEAFDAELEERYRERVEKATPKEGPQAPPPPVVEGPEAPPRAVLDLEGEIAAARDAGQPSPLDPDSGATRRAMSVLRQMYSEGEIDGDQLLAAQSTYMGQVTMKMQQLDAEADQALQALMKTGLEVDDPDLDPTIRSAIEDHGLVPKARAMTRRTTNSRAYDDFWNNVDKPAFAKLTFKQLRVRYMPHLSSPHWKEVVAAWEQRQPDGGGAGRIKGKSVQWSDMARMHMAQRGYVTGKDLDENGIPKLNKDDPIEVERWQSMLRDLDKSDVETNQQLADWLDRRFITEVTSQKFVPGWIWDGHEAYKTTFRALTERRQQALRANNKELADQLWTEMHTATMTMQDGTVVRADPKTVLGPQHDPIPTRALEYMRDEWRLDILDRSPRVTPKQYKAYLDMLEGYGARDPNKELTPGVRLAIDTMFEQIASKVTDQSDILIQLDGWPAHELQWQWWKKTRDKAPWTQLAPRRRDPRLDAPDYEGVPGLGMDPGDM